MKEIYRSPNPVDLSVIQSLLSSEGIEYIVFDQNASYIYGPFESLSPRLMVADDDVDAALAIIKDAGYGD